MLFSIVSIHAVALALAVFKGVFMSVARSLANGTSFVATFANSLVPKTALLAAKNANTDASTQFVKIVAVNLTPTARLVSRFLFCSSHFQSFHSTSDKSAKKTGVYPKINNFQPRQPLPVSHAPTSTPPRNHVSCSP